MTSGCPALVLAAGASRRLGQPKALVGVGSTTLVGLAVSRLLDAGCTPVIVVTRQELQFDVMTQSIDATVVVNPDPATGRTGTIQRGLLALMGDKGRVPRKVIIAPVDRPGWSKEHITHLMEQEQTSNLSSNGRRGHPLIIHSNDIEQILLSNPETPLRNLIHAQPCDVDAPFIALNIDTPEDLLLLEKAKHALTN